MEPSSRHGGVFSTPSRAAWQAQQGLLQPFQLQQRKGRHTRLLVQVRDNNVDQALRVLKKKMQREGVFREMKQRKYYEKPSEKRVREQAEAVRRARKLARKQAQREGLLPKPVARPEVRASRVVVPAGRVPPAAPAARRAAAASGGLARALRPEHTFADHKTSFDGEHFQARAVGP
jgi:small subunit ribosomal protein S21